VQATLCTGQASFIYHRNEALANYVVGGLIENELGFGSVVKAHILGYFPLLVLFDDVRHELSAMT
jgi:hypothetical protein